MTTINGPLEIVVRLDPATGELETRFESPECSLLTPGMLWWEKDTRHYVVYQPEDFHDIRLKQRLDTGNMLSPRDPHVRLVHVGAVYGPGPCPPGWIELSRGRAGTTPPG
jgi:hypothetical protein